MSSERENVNSIANEETALLTNPKKPPTRTPLPWSQILIMLMVSLSEPMASQSIYPYINQLVGELDIIGGDKRKVGYYAGLIESLFFATQAITVLQWSRLSDHIGRKPVLLMGMTGLCVSILCFGLSRTFWGLVISRCVCGMLNGNIGVMKSVLGELTDSTNRADGFAFLPVVWGMGLTFGSLMGGNLSKPHDRFPSVFGGPFWEKYPYFLPCAAVAGCVFALSMVVLLFFRETVQIRKAPDDPPRFESQNIPVDDTTTVAPLPQRPRDEPVPLRKLLVFPVVISVANYAALAFLNIALDTLQPLFFAMPLEIGGLGFTPPIIGYILGAYGVSTGVLQVFFFPRIVRYFGLKRVLVTGMFSFIPMFCLFPITSAVAQARGISPIIWVLVAAQIGCEVIMDMAFGCVFMYIASASPNKRSLGSTNGLAQTTVSIARAIGPAVSASLFSFSVEHNILGGYGVYALLTIMSALGLLLAVQLPQGEWENEVE